MDIIFHVPAESPFSGTRRHQGGAVDMLKEMALQLLICANRRVPFRRLGGNGSGKEAINISRLVSGIYYLRIEALDGEVVNRKVVVQQ